MSVPGYTWQCGSNYTGINLQKLQDKNLISTLENNIRGGMSIVMGDHYAKTDENKKIMYIDATNLYGHSMIQTLLCDEFEIDKKVKLEEILNTPYDSDIGYFVGVDL